MVAGSIPEVAGDHFHLQLSSPNLTLSALTFSSGSQLTTDTTYPDVLALEWYEWDPEEFELVVSTDSSQCTGFEGLTHVLL